MVHLTWIPHLSMCLLVCLSPVSVCLEFRLSMAVCLLVPKQGKQGLHVCNSNAISKQVTAGLCDNNQSDSNLDVSHSMFMQRVPFLDWALCLQQRLSTSRPTKTL